jgi:excisionase family DNA binding protein
VPEPRKTPLTSDNNTVLTGNPPLLFTAALSMTNVFTLGESSQLFKSASVNIYRLLRKKRLPVFKVGSDWRFNVESIDRWPGLSRR